MFFTLFGYWLRVGESPKGLVHNLLMRFFTVDNSKITSQRLLDQSRAGVYRANATYPPFWAFVGLFAYPISSG